MQLLPRSLMLARCRRRGARNGRTPKSVKYACGSAKRAVAGATDRSCPPSALVGEEANDYKQFGGEDSAQTRKNTHIAQRVRKIGRCLPTNDTNAFLID